MSTRQFLLLVVTAVYFCLAHTFINRVCTDCDGCKVGETREEVISSTGALAAQDELTDNIILEPIVFKWNNSESITSEKFTSYKTKILSEMKEGQRLEVYGYYFEEEATPTAYANMGLARADELIELLAESIPKEKMTPRARLIEEKEGVRENLFISTRHRWVEEKAAEEEKNSRKDDERVEVVGDRTLIYFAFNSVKKEINPEVDAYLAKLATRIKSTGESIELIGHTDDVGSDMSNYALALKRAQIIQNILLDKGVLKTKIVSDSRGETEPTAPNNTAANRRLNRRVELKIRN